MIEAETAYRPGACTELGCADAPGSFGTTTTDDGVRIVWHYQASSESRRFRVRYRLRGVPTAYDDIVDVNLKIWGDEWEVGLDQLTSTLIAPGEVQRAWGHPVSVRGDVTIDGSRVNLRAVNIPPQQFVELRALIPRRFFTSTAAMQVDEGLGLDDDRGRGACGCGGVRARPPEDRRGARQPAANARHSARARARPGAADSRLRLVALRPRAPDDVRPRVRAGAAHRDAGRARPIAARPGGHARVARVHGHALRPDPPRALPGRPGDDGAEDLGRAEDAAGRRSRARARRRRSAGRGVRGAGGRGRRRNPRRGPGAAFALP